MRKLILLGLTSMLVACSALPERSQHNDYHYQVNSNSDSWRYVWLPDAYSEPALLKKKFATYQSFYIAPTQLAVQESEFTEAELREFANFLESEAQKKLGAYKTPVSAPQVNGLNVQFALVNVETPNSILAVTSTVLPVGLAISFASLLATGEHTNVTTARIEVLISDGETGEPLFAAIDPTAGDKSLDNIIDPEQEIKKILKVWVDKLGHTLEQLPKS
ncbi:DUF3313 family protein [Motilimonas eburnea]|uniref:DUF3313 family protein n=1 Tax=Motilimonas eburnea TaxID=1737488 RepID=UPI001E4B3E28|nr:DUF3313 family protein [Motilimonas eburnea]MCE2570485.1 DUF3313 domain-containing protein [Motilimonas eburnea]